jgi:hypothetical protein
MDAAETEGSDLEATGLGAALSDAEASPLLKQRRSEPTEPGEAQSSKSLLKPSPLRRRSPHVKPLASSRAIRGASAVTFPRKVQLVFDVATATPKGMEMGT